MTLFPAASAGASFFHCDQQRVVKRGDLNDHSERHSVDKVMQFTHRRENRPFLDS